MLDNEDRSLITEWMAENQENFQDALDAASNITDPDVLDIVKALMQSVNNLNCAVDLLASNA